MLHTRFQRVRLASILTTMYCVCFTACNTAHQYLASGSIRHSVVYDRSVLHVDSRDFQDTALLTIRSSDIVIDFGGTVIDGRIHMRSPDTFKGVAIHILNCKNVTIRNFIIHGFKIAILAENVENLRIEYCNLSYNYRPKLHSKWDRESLTDWLYYHQNAEDEWKRYGAAIYLKNSDNATVKDVLCHQGMNGLLMVNCEKASVYNNNFSFNSGLGIGLYRSSHNNIVHNKLDWNARGYSHGKYARGQDSSAILLYEQSSHNIIAYNSATHSGDGLFLWAGQYTMDTGLGGCDSNMIYRNDFSHSIANGIEVTFSANVMIENILNDSRYGVWGGYSHHSIMTDNAIMDCDYGIAIEHGNHIVIEGNRIVNCPIGIQLWQRATQPADWPYAQIRDVRSRNYSITGNTFEHLHTAIDVSDTDSVFVADNRMHSVVNDIRAVNSQVLTGEKAWINTGITLPERLHDGMHALLSPGVLRGREYIIVNAWGPYNFQYPHLVLRNQEVIDDQHVFTFAVFGPRGLWSVKSHHGFDSVSQDAGNIPDTLIAYHSAGSAVTELVLTYSGPEFIDQFGDTVRSGEPHTLRFADHTVRTTWDVAFFVFDQASHPVDHDEQFARILEGTPLRTETYPQLAFRWWGKPVEGVPADQFAIQATAKIHTTAGEYLFEVESDDGVRLWLDDILILERWDVHTPIMDEVTVSLSEGDHVLRVEYFDAGGLAVLDVTIVRTGH